jgi:flagellar capping protein FliD
MLQPIVIANRVIAKEFIDEKTGKAFSFYKEDEYKVKGNFESTATKLPELVADYNKLISALEEVGIIIPDVKEED